MPITQQPICARCNDRGYYIRPYERPGFVNYYECPCMMNLWALYTYTQTGPTNTERNTYPELLKLVQEGL